MGASITLDHPADLPAPDAQGRPPKPPQGGSRPLRPGSASEGTYPLHAARPYPREQWYIGAYCSEVREGAVLARRIFNEPIVFFRSAGGEVSALSGLCVHRFMPLDQAPVIDDNLVCPYHGYAYGPDGRCVKMATGGTPSPHARLRRYPVVEDGPFVWIWTGTASPPTEAAPPDLADIGLSGDGAGWRVDLAARLDLPARAALLVDNLFDLSHIAFIHAKTLPGAEALALISPVFEVASERFRVGRYIPGFMAEPGTVVGDTMPIIVGRPVFATLHTDFYSPALINSSGPWADELVNGGPGSPIGKLNFVHGITPETENSTHYFNVATRNFLLDDEDLSARLVSQTDRVRMEDVVALAAIEKIADRMNAKHEISSKADEGALKVRRRLKAMIDAEMSGSA